MRRPSFTLEQLRSFVAVAEHGHVSRAAASLFLTQAAVTQQVRNFEHVLGLQLLERDELVLVAHRDHPLSHLRQVTADDLAQHRYLGRGPQWSAERAVREMIGEAYDKVEVLNLGHPEYVRAAAVAGLGFAALSKRAVASEIHSGLLRRLPIPPFLRSITAVRREGRGGPSQEAFWGLVTGEGIDAPSK